MVGESEDRRDYAHINALLLETRETVIRLDANLNSKLDILLQTREDLEDRLGKVEEKCEIKRIRMESFTPILATVYGVGPHDPGLV